MRRGVAAVLLLSAPVAAAQERAPVTADARGSIYRDSDRTTILTTTVAAAGTAGRTTVGARYLLDAISSASVDVVSAATTRFTEKRHEAAGNLAFGDGTRGLAAGYIYSTEPDWDSHNVSFGGTHDFLRHDLTLGAGWSGVWNHVGRTNDPGFSRRLTVHAGNATATVVLSPRSLTHVALWIARADGYQASPYRFVRVGGAGSGLAFPETHPQTRLRAALSARYHRHVGADSAVQTHARAYGDDWGVRSVTAGGEILIGFGEITLGVGGRGYGQGPAAFYRARYDAPARSMSSDRELGTFVDVFGGARLVWRRNTRGIVSDVRAEAKVQGFAFRFYDFPPLRERAGIVADLALGASL